MSPTPANKLVNEFFHRPPNTQSIALFEPADDPKAKPEAPDAKFKPRFTHVSKPKAKARFTHVGKPKPKADFSPPPVAAP